MNFMLLVFLLLHRISDYAIASYKIISIKNHTTCIQSAAQKLPVLHVKRPLVRVSSARDTVKAQFKVCSAPRNATFCSDITRSRWWKLVDCTYDRKSDSTSCDINDGEFQLPGGFGRIFVYVNDTIKIITDQFWYPLSDACLCLHERDYLPNENSRVLAKSRRDGLAFLELSKPKYLKKSVENAHIYDFYLIRSDSPVQKVVPTKNSDPLIFEVRNLTRCQQFDFQVTVLPQFLTCRFETSKYYYRQTFTYDPDNDCVQVSQNGNVLTIIIGVLLSLTGCCVMIIFVLLRRYRNMTRRTSLDIEILPPSSSRSSSVEFKSGKQHDYDSVEINIYEEIPAQNVPTLKREPGEPDFL